MEDFFPAVCNQGMDKKGIFHFYLFIYFDCGAIDLKSILPEIIFFRFSEWLNEFKRLKSIGKHFP